MSWSTFVEDVSVIKVVCELLFTCSSGDCDPERCCVQLHERQKLAVRTTEDASDDLLDET